MPALALLKQDSNEWEYPCGIFLESIHSMQMQFHVQLTTQINIAVVMALIKVPVVMADSLGSILTRHGTVMRT
jgi:hypothetical protein